MGKSKVESQEEGFDLLEEEKNQVHKENETNEKTDVYNLLGNLRLQYVTKKSKNGKVNLQLQLQSKEQLMTLLNNISKIQNTLETNEYIVAQIAQRHPYTLTLVITKNNTILKIVYLSGFIKNVNMSIPISTSTINSLSQIISTLQNNELGKKLLSISTLSNNTEQTQNLL
jgi:hypothetical protein